MFGSWFKRARLPGLTASALAILCWGSLTAASGGQSPAGAPPATAIERDQKQPPPAPPPPPPETYTYRPEGRRDPFVSLLNRGLEPRPAGKAAEGIANLTVAEIVLKGILKSRGTYLAMVQGPSMKTYIVRPKERLVDGVIKDITADSLIIVQDVNDPLSVTKQREVRKTLREL
jgi:Tfp pilus assembly protein PilP